MIIFVPRSGQTQLLQSNDFQNLHCDIALADTEADIARLALHGIASLEQSHAWVSTDWLRKTGTLANGPGWLPRFEMMIDKARPHGWVSADGQSVKAHIAWNNL